jgi:hypothetical protein
MKKFPRSLWWLVAVWAVILLAPSLRALWRVQAFSALFAVDDNLPPLFWQTAAQKFPGDIAILAQAAEETTPVPQSEYSDEIEAPAPLPNPSNPFSVKLMPSPLFPGKPRDTTEFEKMRRYDQLIKKYPDDVWLIARRLRYALSSYRANRLGGELSDGAIVQHLQAGEPSPERSDNKPNFTSADLQRAIVLAKRGQKLEPNNSFFDWALCIFSLMGWRDKEAWQALDSGARKTAWDNHQLEDARNEIAAYEKVFGHALLFEEKMALFVTIQLGEFSRYRETARIISWEGIKAKRRGDHAQALRLWGNLARIAQRMREGSSGYVEGLVGMAIEDLAYGNANYNPRRYLPGSTLPRRVSPQQRLAAFQTYARQHGRADLARAAAREAQRTAAYLKRANASAMSQGLYGIPFWQMTASGVLFQLGKLFFFLLPAVPLLWLLLGALQRNRRVRILPGLSENDEILPRSEIIGGALACGGLRALGSAVFAAIVIGLGYALLMCVTGHQQQLLKWWNDTFTVSSGNLSLIGKFSYRMLDWVYLDFSSLFRWLLPLLPLALGLLYALWRASERQRLQNGEISFHFRCWFISLVRGRSFNTEFDLAQAVLKLFDFVLYIGFAAAWIVIAATPYREYATFYTSLFIVLLCAGLLFFERFQVWRKRPRRREAARYAIKLWRANLWGWLVLGSTLYLITLLGAWPLRASADAKMDGVIRYGEAGAAQKK